MILSEIQVATPYKSSFDYLYEGFICMSELFARILYTYKWKSEFGKISIILFSETSNKKTKFGNILEYEIQFDFETYISLSNFERRLKIIYLIHDQLIIFAQDYNLDTIPIEETFVQCKNLGYENKWIHNNKKYTSPRRDYKVQLQCEWNETHLIVFINIFDWSGSLINKHKWFEVVSRVGYTIYSYKGSFIDDYIFDFRDQYLLEKWKVDIREIIPNIFE